MADASRQNAEHQVADGVPVAAHAKMAPAELAPGAGVHSLRRGAFAESPAPRILMADGAPGGCRPSPFLLALRRTARIVVDVRNMARGRTMRPDLHRVIGTVHQYEQVVGRLRGHLRERDRRVAAFAQGILFRLRHPGRACGGDVQVAAAIPLPRCHVPTGFLECRSQV